MKWYYQTWIAADHTHPNVFRLVAIHTPTQWTLGNPSASNNCATVSICNLLIVVVVCLIIELIRIVVIVNRHGMGITTLQFDRIIFTVQIADQTVDISTTRILRVLRIHYSRFPSRIANRFADKEIVGGPAEDRLYILHTPHAKSARWIYSTCRIDFWMVILQVRGQ